MYRNEAVEPEIWVLIIVVYFVPALIAKKRDTENLEAIFLVNLVFGWTVLGWIAALIWAIVEKAKFKSSIEDSWDGPTVDAAQTEAPPMPYVGGGALKRIPIPASLSSNPSAACEIPPRACHSLILGASATALLYGPSK